MMLASCIEWWKAIYKLDEQLQKLDKVVEVSKACECDNMHQIDVPSSGWSQRLVWWPCQTLSQWTPCCSQSLKPYQLDPAQIWPHINNCITWSSIRNLCNKKLSIMRSIYISIYRYKRGLLNRPCSLLKWPQRRTARAPDLSKFEFSLHTWRGARCQLCFLFLYNLTYKWNCSKSDRSCEHATRLCGRFNHCAVHLTIPH